MCIHGSEVSLLKVPVGHGYISGGRKKANCRDCRACENIPYFGGCRLNKASHTCEGFMRLADRWESTEASLTKPEKVDGEDAITMDSVLLCKKGGVIIPLTSGQGYEERVDLLAFWGRFRDALLWAAGKDLGCQAFGGDPVNMNTGNFVYEKEDLVTGGRTKLSFGMCYNSVDGHGGCIGEGWRHSGEWCLEKGAGGMVYLHTGEGKRTPYSRSTGGIYTPPLGGIGLLKEVPGGFLYGAGGGLEYRFDSAGRLVWKTDREGNRDSYSYDAEGRLAEASGANGGRLTYHYNREGRLTRVSDHTGREVCLYYSYGKLKRYVDACGHAYTYTYNENGRLESVETPGGVKAFENRYDSLNRVVRQEMADGGVTELKYDDRNLTTWQKEPNGNIVAYESDERFRNTRTVYQDGEETFAYNDKNQIRRYVDKLGNVTRYQYDERGNLTGLTDALGGHRSYQYNAEGLLLNICVEGKKMVSNAYDEAGRITKREDALGRSRAYVWNANGQPEQIILPDKSRVLFAYDERGNVQSITDPYGSRIRYEYDALNRVVSTADEEGNKFFYTYDERNHLLSMTNPEGNTRRYTYNLSGKLVQIDDFDGGILTISYNAAGKPETFTDKEGNRIHRTYDKMGNVAKEVSPTGAISAFWYDGNNRLIRMERKGDEGEETVCNYVYDPNGNLLCISLGTGDEALAETFYEYDSLNRISVVTDPAGGKTCYTYDRRTGKVSSITDAARNKRTFRYYDTGELAEATDIRGNTTRYEYNGLGQICRISDGAGRVMEYFHEPGGRLQRSVYPDGNQICYEYDSLGRVSGRVNSQGYRISYQYDCMSRLVKVLSSEGQEKAYTYDAAGNVASVTDACGFTTRYGYTLNGKLKEVEDSMGNRTGYGYDAAGRLTSVCQYGKGGEEDRITTFERDALGQAKRIRDGMGGEEAYQYDALGRMTGKTDKEGLETRYTYTPDGRIESILYGDGRQAEFAYTPLRQLALVKDWLGETRIERNRLGEPLWIMDHAGHKVGYEWGQFGERKGMIYPDGTKISYRYDDLLRLTELERSPRGPEGLHISCRYDGQGRLAEKKCGGKLTKWHYNSQGQLKELTHEDGQGTLERFCYEYDAMGNKTAVRKERRGLPEESGSYRYCYDGLGRLMEVWKDGKPLRSYQYDSFGNRIGMGDYMKGTQTAFAYDALNRLEKVATWKPDGLPQGNGAAGGQPQEGVMAEFADDKAVYRSYTYDKRGNLTGEYREGELIHGYAYGASNRLERAWDNAGREASYAYNGLGQRTGRAEGEQTEAYLLDLTKPYHNLLGTESGELRHRFYWDYGLAAEEETGRLPRYYLPDELGSPLRVLYSTGNGEVYGYDEFGQDLYEPEKGQRAGRYSRQGEGQPFGYTGYRYDGISGTYFAQAREYKAGLGRFAAEDIIPGNDVMPKTLNKYGYCLNSPLIYIDPLGLVSEEVARNIIKENAQYINAAAEEFGVDPNVLSGCIYAEQVRNVDFKDNFDTFLVVTPGLDSSVGVAQVKVSTAKLLQEKGYMPYGKEPTWIEQLCGISKETTIAFSLEDNETNIYYAAAYLKYIIEEWSSEYPKIKEDIAIQATLYNLGHEKIKNNFLDKILGTLFEGFKEPRIPHPSPSPNEFGDYVLGKYDLMPSLLEGEKCEN